MMTSARLAALFLLLAVAVGGFAQSDETGQIASAPDQAGAPINVEEDPRDIPLEVLEMQIKHLSTGELVKVADQWMARLRRSVERLNEAKIEVYAENQKLQAVEEEAGEDAPGDDDQPDQLVEAELAVREDMLQHISDLRDERAKVIDRLNVVLDELSLKLGLTADSEEQDAVREYRRYIEAVKGVEVDTSDWQSLRTTAIAWLVSEEGGQRLGKHLLKFFLIIFLFWLLSLVLGKLAGKAMSLASNASQLLRKFVQKAIRGVTIAFGIIFGLAALEINVLPLLALIGAAGFVIAFALQDTLSNFASGLMIMFYKPFDIGDFVDTPDVTGTVRSMTLVTTNVLTPDNKLMVVPNNDLWGKVITNVTGSSERRIDLVFGIGYGDDIGKAERVLNDVVSSHPKVLEMPKTVIKVHELGDSSVNFVCRPWVKTEDYWEVHWDITRAVKERFDAEGISIPFPQRDVHVHQANSQQAASES